MATESVAVCLSVHVCLVCLSVSVCSRTLRRPLRQLSAQQLVQVNKFLDHYLVLTWRTSVCGVGFVLAAASFGGRTTHRTEDN